MKPTPESLLIQIHTILCTATTAEEAWTRACKWQYDHKNQLCDLTRDAQKPDAANEREVIALMSPIEFIQYIASGPKTGVPEIAAKNWLFHNNHDTSLAAETLPDLTDL